MTEDRKPITDDEYETHIVPVVAENWAHVHGRQPWGPASTEADYQDMLTWARQLRADYDADETFEISWR